MVRLAAKVPFSDALSMSAGEKCHNHAQSPLPGDDGVGEITDRSWAFRACYAHFATA